MDFDDISLFKLMFIFFGVLIFLGIVHDIYKNHLEAEIEIAKIKNSGKCEDK